MYEQSFFEGITAQENHTFSHERHYIKITDTAANEIISYAIWEELSDGYKPEEDFQAVFHPLPEGANEEMARDFCAMTARFRGEGERSKEGHWCKSIFSEIISRVKFFFSEKIAFRRPVKSLLSLTRLYRIISAVATRNTSGTSA